MGKTTLKTYKQFIQEAVYAGNLGFIEMARFHADPNIPKREKERHMSLMQSGYIQRAAKMIEKYTGKKFDPSLYPKREKSK